MYHKIIVAGNLGGDPEMRYFPDGSAVTNFSIASNKKWKDKDGNQVEETVWFRVSVFGPQAESCNTYLSKGRGALVEGTLNADRNTGGPRLWTGQDGTVRASYEIRAQTVRFLGGAGDASYASEPASQLKGDEEDEVPF